MPAQKQSGSGRRDRPGASRRHPFRARRARHFKDGGNHLMPLGLSTRIVGSNSDAVADVVQATEVVTGRRVAFRPINERAAMDLLGHPLNRIGKGHSGAARQVAKGGGADDLIDNLGVDNNVETLGRLIEDGDVRNFAGREGSGGAIARVNKHAVRTEGASTSLSQDVLGGVVPSRVLALVLKRVTILVMIAGRRREEGDAEAALQLVAMLITAHRKGAIHR